MKGESRIGKSFAPLPKGSCRVFKTRRSRTTVSRLRGWRKIGESPSGKATGFGPVTRGFESLLPNMSVAKVGEEGFERAEMSAERSEASECRQMRVNAAFDAALDKEPKATRKSLRISSIVLLGKRDSNGQK